MPGPHPAVARLRTAVATALTGPEPVPPGALVLVACSGGADSLALAAAAVFAVRPHGPDPRPVAAVVVDHGMQSGSGAVADRAAAQCRSLGLDPVRVVRVRVGTDGGPEAAARRARYTALTETADRLGAAAVLLGHTRDDQAEGVLLGLARGSGARSLSGMAPRRGRWLRPLLDLPRADTEAACAALGLDPWRDPTNTADQGTTGDRAPLRSRVRSRVLPVLDRELGPGVSAALARTARSLREDADALDEIAAQWEARAVTPGADGVVRVRIEVLLGAGDTGEAPRPSGAVAAVAGEPARLQPPPLAVRRRVLRAAALRAGVPSAALTRTHLLAVDGLLTNWRGQGAARLPGGVVARRSYGTLELGVAGDPGPNAAAEPHRPESPDTRH